MMPVAGFAAPPAELLEARLRALGLDRVREVRTHRNRSVMASLARGVLRVHAGYAHAPDRVLRAIVRFFDPRTPRPLRHGAQQELLAFPAPEFVPPLPARRRAASATAPEDERLLQRVRAAFDEFNARHFGGTLSAIPLRLSARMRRKLGHVALEPRTGRALEIVLSRRHVRRDGATEWRETLLHEMVHQWQAETAVPVDHGPGFRRKAREVGITPRAVRAPRPSGDARVALT